MPFAMLRTSLALSLSILHNTKDCLPSFFNSDEGLTRLICAHRVAACTYHWQIILNEHRHVLVHRHIYHQIDMRLNSISLKFWAPRL
jgi:hypothetical protein